MVLLMGMTTTVLNRCLRVVRHAAADRWASAHWASKTALSQQLPLRLIDGTASMRSKSAR